MTPVGLDSEQVVRQVRWCWMLDQLPVEWYVFVAACRYFWEHDFDPLNNTTRLPDDALDTLGENQR